MTITADIICKKLTDYSPFPILLINKANDRRIFMEIPMEYSRVAIRHCKFELGFDHLSTITGLHEGEQLMMLYHLSRLDQNGLMLNIRIRFDQNNHSIPTVSDIFPAAVYYEQEILELLGINIDGLPGTLKYPLPDSWPKGEYPLRKDWKPKGGSPTETVQDQEETP